MGVIYDGSFFKKIDAYENNGTVAKQFVSIWEKKNSKTARAGGLSLMALSLAACGGDDGEVAAVLASAVEAAAAAAEKAAAEKAAVEKESAELEAVVIEVLPVTKALAADEDATGTAGADIFTATTATMTAATTLVGTNDITGGEGPDIFQLAMGANFDGFTVTGTNTGSMTKVETVELTNTGSIARTFNATGVSDVETYIIDGTNGVVNIAGATELSTIDLSNLASGAFSVTYAAPTGGTSPVAGTADVLNLVLEALGSSTADVTITAAGAETVAITANVAATAADSDIFVDLSKLTGALVGKFYGRGNFDISGVNHALTEFDASPADGSVTAVLTNAAADALAIIKTGLGDDSITADIGDIKPTAVIALGDGDDTLILSGVGETTQYVMSGVDTLDLTDVTGTSTFSLTKATSVPSTIQLGEAGVVTPNPSAGTHTFVGDSGAKTVNIRGDSTNGLTTDTAGAVTVNVTADGVATAANGGDTSAATVTANSSSELIIDVSGVVNHTGAITAAKATSVTAYIQTELANTTTIAAAKAEKVDITTTKGGVISAYSDFTAAQIVKMTTAGTLQNLEVLPAAATVTLTGAGTKAGWNGDALIGSATLEQNLTVTASGFAAGFDQAGGGINSGLGMLHLNMNKIDKGDITTGALTSKGLLSVSANTSGTFQTGVVTGKSVSIDTSDVLGALTYGNIIATSGVGITGSTLLANVVTVDASATSTALTVDFVGGNAIDTLDIDTSATTKSVTVTGAASNDADTITIDVAAFTTDTTSTVTIDVSGVAADTTNQTAITIETDAELNNDMVITGSKGTGDTLALGTSVTYTGDMTISGIEAITHTAATVTAATLNGVTATLTGAATTDDFIIVGAAAVNDVIDVSNITHNGAAAVDFVINADTGDDIITGTASHDTIDAADGADTVNISDGTDVITLGGADGDADSVRHLDVDTNAGTSTVTEFITTQDTLFLSAADLNTVAGATLFAAGDTVTVRELEDADATTTVADVAGTLIYDEDTGVLSLDVDGDTESANAATNSGTTDDVALITISNVGAFTGDIIAADITILA